MVYEGWLGSVRCSSNLSSVRLDARYFEPSPLLGSINLEPISSQIERLGIDCHLWRHVRDKYHIYRDNICKASRIYRCYGRINLDFKCHDFPMSNFEKYPEPVTLIVYN